MANSKSEKRAWSGRGRACFRDRLRSSGRSENKPVSGVAGVFFRGDTGRPDDELGGGERRETPADQFAVLEQVQTRAAIWARLVSLELESPAYLVRSALGTATLEHIFIIEASPRAVNQEGWPKKWHCSDNQYLALAQTHPLSIFRGSQAQATYQKLPN